MNRQKWTLLLFGLALMCGTAVVLGNLHEHQRLGAPAVITHALPGSIRLAVNLPERVLDYQSEWVDVDDVTKSSLPQDTSFGQRLYHAPDGFVTQMRVVLMGADRTSLHKPQFCLTGQGFQIDQGASSRTTIRVDRPCSYDLPVVKLVASKEITFEGQKQLRSAIYVYWFVADNYLSASVSGFERMWSMASVLLRTGMLQRWAYVSCFADCAPGQEDATFGRMKKFIAASVPEFQLTPKPGHAEVTAR